MCALHIGTPQMHTLEDSVFIGLLLLLQLPSTSALQWPASVTIIRAGGENVTVYGQPATGTPALAAEGMPMELRFGGHACTPPAAGAVHTEPFALLVERGLCSFDDKMRSAVSSGASVLLVADSLRGEYRATDDGAVARMALNDPCAVDCASGMGFVDPQRISVEQVLNGLAESCGLSCRSRTCAFSGRSNESLREVCCFSDQSLDMALPLSIKNNTVVPAVFIALSQVGRVLPARPHRPQSSSPPVTPCSRRSGRHTCCILRSRANSPLSPSSRGCHLLIRCQATRRPRPAACPPAGNTSARLLRHK